ncbi:3-deoxy-manno-octulosonate cytidylyltransferase [Parasphingopyxis lamellibrachiae]|uniref:3-deoxy-manno-octulosonate cytidylyltransferase n=1 Tax=Parasphingopyxis lamellibrachiae TaxID=680125 RepID=A0A3D9FDX4_9SPHN|nr:3-deoxy-manno-octulosonate cytidylyltransferase [Parasphingopyxis lamellibrachiae]RED16020.1 3-deoxy-manno-octulosonate cytidylyltransferase (CMP-KDO synthetase) [Parasphingopyxis lamellibrachiae]
MKVVAIIPARWGSTRFPGKVLTPIAGKPMITRVWEKARAASGIDDVIVATDDDRIADTVREFGGRVEMTRSDHESGSDRIAEVAARIEADAIINVQGDEPLVRSGDLDRLAAMMREDRIVRVASLCHAISDEEANNPNRVKVVRNAAGDALYFSRAKIPHPRHGDYAQYFQHAGIYAYRRSDLLAFSTLLVPAEERAEALEQLRYLAAGIAIRLIETEPSGPGVDAPEDVAIVEKLLAR